MPKRSRREARFSCVDPQPRGGRAENLVMLLPFAAPGDAVALVEFLCALAAWHRAVGTPGWDEPLDAAAAVLVDRPDVTESRRRRSTALLADDAKN
jgi:hypothetical protein